MGVKRGGLACPNDGVCRDLPVDQAAQELLAAPLNTRPADSNWPS